jgi:hypothetical protein
VEDAKVSLAKAAELRKVKKSKEGSIADIQQKLKGTARETDALVSKRLHCKRIADVLAEQEERWKAKADASEQLQNMLDKKSRLKASLHGLQNAASQEQIECSAAQQRASDLSNEVRSLEARYQP